ncbi:hypothetical protein [Bosea psychrotolerans]|uniref:Lipoprotein n=1 Tax=Bosea psychrotolerans TaxID=1871628 RepID=A0A2S4MP70_9HYPH|nr:hypothetical protein [Bosea psychrotolerans]POR56540.1 hypothetical protein CYD53_10160 [Bosea psychrotolerans]
MGKSVVLAAVSAVLLAGCNAHTVTVPAGGNAIVSQLAMFQLHACTSWEPPRAKLDQLPINGTASIGQIKGVITAPSHPCAGTVLDRTVVSYTPRPGFVGQDSLSVTYDYITNDAGGRGNQTDTVTIQVR